ncbi:MAG: hypothetical protein WD431_02565 [Cyclobacteriaceae bacterium]
MMKIKITPLLFLLVLNPFSIISQTILSASPVVFPQKFVHPGMLQKVHHYTCTLSKRAPRNTGGDDGKNKTRIRKNEH